MRPGQQSSKNRSRGRGNNNGGRKHSNPLSRNYESNGPDVKIRGNAAHIAEKYVQLARDAHASGDSVMAENYLQHAEHYFRILSAAQPQGMPRPDQFANDGDMEDDEAEEFAGVDGEQGARQPDEGQREERFNREERPRREERVRRDENQPHIERPAFVPEVTGEPGAGAQQPAEVAAEGEANEPKRPRRQRRRPRAAAEGQVESEDSQGETSLPAFLTGTTAAE